MKQLLQVLPPRFALSKGYLELPIDLAFVFFTKENELQEAGEWDNRFAWLAYGKPKYPQRLYLKPTVQANHYHHLANYVPYDPTRKAFVTSLRDGLRIVRVRVYAYEKLLIIDFDEDLQKQVLRQDKPITNEAYKAAWRKAYKTAEIRGANLR